MGVIAEPFHELLRRLVQHRMMGDLVHPVFEFHLRWQVTEEQQVRHFQEGAALGKGFYRIAAIAEDATLTIDESDAAPAGSRIHESRIIGHESEVFWTGLDAAQVHRPKGSL